MSAWRRPPAAAIAFASAFAAAASLAAATGAWAYHTRFVANNCNYNPSQATSFFTRSGSIHVALNARYEGYQWGGGYLRICISRG
jgi:hypothetical protein